MKSVRAQAGNLILPLLSLMIVLGSYLGLQQINSGQRATQSAEQKRLQLAKEALIARAVTDANRPGSFPCPDLKTDNSALSNHPNDGKSDLLTGNECPSYIGWLPWVTLDLPELTDHSGSRFWYALSPALRDDDQAQPINSSTTTALALDNRNDIAALIIAPGAALNGQMRPSNRPADYLEGDNALGGNHYNSGPASEKFNDRVLAISRQELMAAVEKRVANELQRCLEQHATHPANIRHSYPWPSPFNVSNGRGQAGSLFGQVPQTQPGRSVQAELSNSNLTLREARQQLGTTTQPAELLNTLSGVNEQLAFGQILYDRIYSSATSLALNAKTSKSQLSELDKTVLSANSNGKITATERTNIQSDSGHAGDQLITLRQQLKDLGFDVFPDELKLRQDQLDSALQQMSPYPDKNALNLLASRIDELQTLFSHSQTQNVDIAQSLNLALSSSLEAMAATQTAIAEPTDPTKLSNALALGRSLKLSSEQLQNTINNNRIGLHPGEIMARTDSITRMLASLSPSDDSGSMTPLRQILAEIDALIRTINSQSSHLLPRINKSLNAISSAQQAGNASNWPNLLIATHDVVSATAELGNAMLNNGDNLTLESLQYRLEAFASQTNSFSTMASATQTEMVPYAENIRRSAANLQFWAEIIERHTSTIALQARKAPEAGKTQVNPDAAFSLAEQALSSINKSSGSLKKLQDWLDDPNDSRKQSAASLALSDTLSQLDKLLQSTASLGEILHGNEADAFPTLWYGSHCAFLQPVSGTSSWWLDNHWSETTFYQISQGLRGEMGRLTVNNSGQYHSIVISAGPVLGNQNRLIRQSSNFFESSHADSSRDGPATTPRPDFISRSVTNEFNDRLAY